MVIQCKNLISLYILHDQRRVNLPFRKKFVTNKNPNLMVMSKTVLSKIPCRFTHRRSGKYNFFQGSQVRCFHFDEIRQWGATSLWGSTRGLFVLLYDEIKIMKTH